MFSTPRMSGAAFQKSPANAVSHIESFQTLDVAVFHSVQEFFLQLGIPFQTDNKKRIIKFNLSIAEKRFMENIQKLTYGVIAFDSDGNKMTVDRVDAAKLTALFAKDFPVYTAFQSTLPACTVVQHPAFIKDYSAAHTDIIKRCPAGTYAMMNEEGNHYLLVYIDGNDKQYVAHGIQFIENHDGTIQSGNEHYHSIHDFLHDGQYILTRPYQFTVEKQPLGRTLTDIIDQNQELQNEVAAYVETRKNPEILRIVDFLNTLFKSTRRHEEEALLSSAIHLLYLKPASACDILDGLTRTLPAASSGRINAPFISTIGGSDNHANYYSDILQSEARDEHSNSVDHLMQQLTEMYAEKSNRMRY